MELNVGAQGVFKPMCRWGHSREGNVAPSGHCLTCIAERGNEDLQETRRAQRKGGTSSGTFKPLCVRGHDRFTYADESGHCRKCEKELWRPTEKKNLRSNAERIAKVNDNRWKSWNVSNEDGSPFTSIDYNRAFQIQGGKCRGCDRHQSGFKKALIADHSHDTGIFRGLLCASCNFILGLAKDDPEILKTLTEYLGDHL